MSHPVNDELKEQFMAMLNAEHLCPYCGARKDVQGPDMWCCGELHAGPHYVFNTGPRKDEYFPADELDSELSAWLEALPEPEDGE